MANTETSHFYLGQVHDKERFSALLAENYDRDDDEPVAEFYRSQGKIFCDHDFLEFGIRETESSLQEFFKPYSYSDHWSDTVCRAAKEMNLEDANALIFISKSQISSPCSVQDAGFNLYYIGAYEYPI
ncbi:MAG TPA: immunity 22 family protein [Burkholderiaceae bacterium]|jgi:hypothetical protein